MTRIKIKSKQSKALRGEMVVDHCRHLLAYGCIRIHGVRTQHRRSTDMMPTPTQSRHTHSLNIITITDKQYHNRISNVILVTIGKQVDCAKTVKTEHPKTADKNEKV
jgi:hypothetical protein